MWTDLSSVMSQSTRLTDRRTDRQFSHALPRLHSKQRGENWLRLHSKPSTVMEIHVLDPTVSRLYRPNVSFVYKQSVHGITVTSCLLLSGTFLVTNTIWTKKWNYNYARQKMPVIYRWALSVVPLLSPHTRKVEGHVPLLDIWLRRLWQQCRQYGSFTPPARHIPTGRTQCLPRLACLHGRIDYDGLDGGKRHMTQSIACM